MFGRQIWFMDLGLMDGRSRRNFFMARMLALETRMGTLLSCQSGARDP